MSSKTKFRQKKKVKILLGVLSNLFLLAGFLIFLLTFWSPLLQEIKFQFNKISGVRYQVVQPDKSPAEVKLAKTKVSEIVPLSYDFGLVIPKINANASIFPNVDPFKESEFLPVLKKGVAHAKGTSFPGQGGNIYLFAHSTDAFYHVSTYNAVFFLLGKLEVGDEIDVFYKDKLYRYFVFEKKVVGPSETKYLAPTEGEILTLQTCYPPGTTLRRLIVLAR